jgi:hypothetical protein
MLLAATPWNDSSRLIHQDTATTNYPAVDGTGQVIAVIDTGIDYLEPSLGGGFGPGFKVEAGYDFVDNDSDPFDVSGHGTSVAGVLAASPFDFNGVHYSGIAPNAKLIALRIAENPTDPTPNQLIENALEWVVNHRNQYGITVVNLSFGYGEFNNPTTTGPFSDEIAVLNKANVAVVCSSGNAGITSTQGTEYPSSDPNAISVGAVDSSDVITSYTERGKTLDMLAPGQDIIAPTLAGFSSNDGTSFASPMVAGTAALMREIDPTLTVSDTLSILRASGKDNLDGDTETSPTTGLAFPRLDVNAALALTEARLPSIANPAPMIGAFGNGNSLAYDPQGVLSFAWYDSSTHQLKYASRNTSNVWSATQIIDQASGDDDGQFVSLAVDRDGRAAMAYFDATLGDLEFAEQDNGIWDVQSVDSKQSTGLYPSLAFDQNNDPTIAYYRKTAGHLELAQLAKGQWTLSTIDAGGTNKENVGRSASLALRADGEFGIAYEDTTTGDLMFAQQMASQPTGSTWTTMIADAKTTGVSFISLKYGADSIPCVSYYDAAPANLKYADLKHGKWFTDTIDSKGAVGLYTQLLMPPNGGDVTILYYNRTLNQLMSATGHIHDWETSIEQSNGGRYLIDAMTADGHFSYSWYDSMDATLHIDHL